MQNNDKIKLNQEFITILEQELAINQRILTLLNERDKITAERLKIAEKLNAIKETR